MVALPIPQAPAVHSFSSTSAFMPYKTALVFSCTERWRKKERIYLLARATTHDMPIGSSGILSVDINSGIFARRTSSCRVASVPSAWLLTLGCHSRDARESHRVGTHLAARANRNGLGADFEEWGWLREMTAIRPAAASARRIKKGNRDRLTGNGFNDLLDALNGWEGLCRTVTSPQQGRGGGRVVSSTWEGACSAGIRTVIAQAME
jgi:hypothetical protein